MKSTFKQVGGKVEALLTAYENEILDAISATGKASVNVSMRFSPGGVARVSIKSSMTTINDSTDIQPGLPGTEG